jgi:hypothetical protein
MTLNHVRLTETRLQNVQEFHGLLVAVPTAFLYDTKSYIEAFIHEFRDENHA